MANCDGTVSATCEGCVVCKAFIHDVWKIIAKYDHIDLDGATVVEVQVGDVAAFGNPDGLAFTMASPDHREFIIAVDPKAQDAEAGLEQIIVHELVHVAHGARFGDDNEAALEWLVDELAASIRSAKP